MRKATLTSRFFAFFLAYVRKKQYFCKVFLHIAKLGFICLRTSYTTLIANELPLLPYGGIRIPRLRSHIVSNPQTNATLSQAVPQPAGAACAYILLIFDYYYNEENLHSVTHRDRGNHSAADALRQRRYQSANLRLQKGYRRRLHTDLCMAGRRGLLVLAVFRHGVQHR